jgi:hypothetical protein
MTELINFSELAENIHTEALLIKEGNIKPRDSEMDSMLRIAQTGDRREYSDKVNLALFELTRSVLAAISDDLGMKSKNNDSLNVLSVEESTYFLLDIVEDKPQLLREQEAQDSTISTQAVRMLTQEVQHITDVSERLYTRLLKQERSSDSKELALIEGNVAKYVSDVNTPPQENHAKVFEAQFLSPDRPPTGEPDTFNEMVEIVYRDSVLKQNRRLEEELTKVRGDEQDTPLDITVALVEMTAGILKKAMGLDKFETPEALEKADKQIVDDFYQALDKNKIPTFNENGKPKMTVKLIRSDEESRITESLGRLNPEYPGLEQKNR